MIKFNKSFSTLSTLIAQRFLVWRISYLPVKPPPPLYSCILLHDRFGIGWISRMSLIEVGYVSKSKSLAFFFSFFLAWKSLFLNWVIQMCWKYLLLHCQYLSLIASSSLLYDERSWSIMCGTYFLLFSFLWTVNDSCASAIVATRFLRDMGSEDWVGWISRCQDLLNKCHWRLSFNLSLVSFCKMNMKNRQEARNKFPYLFILIIIKNILN